MFSALDQFAGALFGADGEIATGYTLIYNIALAFCTWQTGGYDTVNAYSMVEEIYRFIAPLAMTLALCFMILGILQAISRYGMENITFTILMMPILRYVSCVVVIKYGLQMTGYIMSGSNSLVQQMNTITITADAALKEGEALDNLTKNKSTLQIVASFIGRLLLEYVPALFSFVFQLCCGVLIAYQIITIRIEFLIRAAFMPLAVADIAQSGVQGNGMKYIKRLIFTMFMLMGILATIKLTFYVVGSIGTTGFDNIFDEGWINKFITNMFIACVGPCCCVGAVTSFKAALNEMY